MEDLFVGRFNERSPIPGVLQWLPINLRFKGVDDALRSLRARGQSADPVGYAEEVQDGFAEEPVFVATSHTTDVSDGSGADMQIDGFGHGGSLTHSWKPSKAEPASNERFEA